MPCVEVPYNVDEKKIYINVNFYHSIDKGKVLPFRSVVDTGATTTCITKRAADALGMSSRGRAYASGGAQGGVSLVNVYSVRLIIYAIDFVREMRVLEMGQRQTYDVILGMDVLSLGTFKFENNMFTLCID